MASLCIYISAVDPGRGIKPIEAQWVKYSLLFNTMFPQKSDEVKDEVMIFTSNEMLYNVIYLSYFDNIIKASCTLTAGRDWLDYEINYKDIET